MKKIALSLVLAAGLSPIREAARWLGATSADLPGLWNVPGHPELTTAQMLQLASETHDPR